MKNYMYKRIKTLLSVMLICSFLLPANTFAASQPVNKGEITASVINRNTVTLKWEKVKKAAKYKIYRKAGDGKYVLVKTTAKKTYQSQSLAYSKKYTFKVTALTKSGKKLSSKTKVVYTKAKKAAKQPVASSITLEQVTAQKAEQQHQPSALEGVVLPPGNLHIKYKGNGCDACSPTFAMFGVYKDTDCTIAVTTEVVDLGGNITIQLPEGTYYLKTIMAPEGHVLDTTIYAVTVEAACETTVVWRHLR